MTSSMKTCFLKLTHLVGKKTAQIFICCTLARLYVSCWRTYSLILISNLNRLQLKHSVQYCWVVYLFKNIKHSRILTLVQLNSVNPDTQDNDIGRKTPKICSLKKEMYQRWINGLKRINIYNSLTLHLIPSHSVMLDYSVIMQSNHHEMTLKSTFFLTLCFHFHFNVLNLFK